MSQPSVRVLAPCPGRVLAMSDVPDTVFAEEMVGPGVAIEPDPGPTTVVAPIAGKLSDRVGSRWLMAGGLTLVATSLLLFSQLDVNSGFWDMFPGLVIAAIVARRVEMRTSRQ